MSQNVMHANNFGFLRLLFAYLVIFSHSPVLVNINPSQDLLHSLTGGVTFGALAVDGFFLISGYLIYQSYENSRSLFGYILKRVLRIYPGFIVASILSVILVVTLAGGWPLLIKLNPYEWGIMVVKTLGLSTPYVNGLIINASIPLINDSMWTIRYEFVCYLMIPLIGFIGLGKIGIFLMTCLFISLHVYLLANNIEISFRNNAFFSSHQFFRLSSAFLVGICFYKFKNAISWNRNYAFFCCLALIGLRFISTTFFEVGLITFGGYLMFNFAFNFKNKMIQRVGYKTDISYGVYLYAWPIQISMVHYINSVNSWQLSTITIILASICGYISWMWVEKPFMDMKKKINHRE